MLAMLAYSGTRSMNKDLKAVIGNVLQSNLAVLGAFIAISSSLPEEQQQKLLESLDTMRNANQALLDMLNRAKT
jgi:Pyruvate/2-oxoacid:ferredoxin oxidoreductase gamma subunit